MQGKFPHVERSATLNNANKETVLQNFHEDNSNLLCKKCSYPLREDAEYCPNCGTPIDIVCIQHKVSADDRHGKAFLKATVRDVSVFSHTGQVITGNHSVIPELYIVPADNFDGKAKPFLAEGKSEVIVGCKELCEDPTVPEKALLFQCDDGKWYVEEIDVSCPVYVRAVKNIEVSKGDIIVVGNRRYMLG